MGASTVKNRTDPNAKKEEPMHLRPAENRPKTSQIRAGTQETSRVPELLGPISSKSPRYSALSNVSKWRHDRLENAFDNLR